MGTEHEHESRHEDPVDPQKLAIIESDEIELLDDPEYMTLEDDGYDAMWEEGETITGDGYLGHRLDDEHPATRDWHYVADALEDDD